MSREPWAALDIAVFLMGSGGYVAAIAAGMRPRYAIPSVVLSAAVFSTCVLVRDDHAVEAMGFRWDNFGECARLVGPPTAVCAFLLIGYGRWRRRTLLRKQILVSLPFYLAWGLVQQTVFQGIFNRQLQQFIATNWLVPVIVGTIFCAVHVPRWWLVVLTAIIGPFWAAAYCLCPNLYALAISHALLGGLAFNCVNGEDPLDML